MKYLVGFLLVTFFILSACNKDEEDTEEVFDREAMLKNYSENLVVPSYEDALSSLNTLKTAVDEFSNDPSSSSLENLQTTWLSSFKDWQYASVYNFGPAAEQGLNKSLNEEIATFPVDASKINDIISTGEYNLQDFNRDSRGFLAIEYLIFGGITVSNSEVVDFFSNQNNRMDYLIACTDHIIGKVENALNSWNNGYSSQFINNNGTDAGSSTSQLYNEFVKSFETIKNLKVELPLGLRPGQTQAEPQLVQAYYSGYSLVLLKEHIQAIENTYFGKNRAGTKGESFKDYLESVVGGPELIDETITQWDVVIAELEAIPVDTPISEQITNNPQPYKDFGEELQRHTRFFKSDMSSRLGIAITYSSGDGD